MRKTRVEFVVHELFMFLAFFLIVSMSCHETDCPVTGAERNGRLDVEMASRWR